MQPCDTSVLDIIQSIVLGLTLIATCAFSWHQLTLSRRALQASTVDRIFAATRDLQMRELGNPYLLKMRSGSSPPTEFDKSRYFVSIMINHYALIYDVFQLKGLPPEIWEELKHDMQDFFALPEVERMWAKVKRYHKGQFKDLVLTLHRGRNN